MQDPRTAVLWAGADHGPWGQKLYRSQDGGKTMEEVAAPQYPEGATIYDIFPGGAKKLVALSYWGESWQALGHSFPPIYSVRFA